MIYAISNSCVCNPLAPPSRSRLQAFLVVLNRRADLHVVGAHLMGKDDLMVDVTVRHDFIGDARDVQRHGRLRNPDRPDQVLNQAAADKIRSYREPYSRNR